MEDQGQLTKHEAVLERDALPGSPTFRQVVDEGEARRFVVMLDHEVWQDMGTPNVITVTVEPGDRLNEASGQPVGG